MHHSNHAAFGEINTPAATQPRGAHASIMALTKTVTDGSIGSWSKMIRNPLAINN
jgi:hypothetical protein